jgi:hypothetical protein
MKKFDLNEIYEELSEAIREEKISYGDVMQMFADFIEDTLILKVELGLSKQQIEVQQKAKRLLIESAKIKFEYLIETAKTGENPFRVI